MIALDGSVMIAYSYSKDPHHESARKILLERADEEFVAHSMTIAETLVGAVRAGRESELLSLLDVVGIHAAPSDEQEPLRLARLRVRTGLKLRDCCALSAAVVTRSTLATFDSRLAEAARSLGLAVAGG